MPVDYTPINPMAGFNWNQMQEAQDSAVKRQSLDMENAMRGLQIQQYGEAVRKQKMDEARQNVMAGAVVTPEQEASFDAFLLKNPDVNEWVKANPGQRSGIMNDIFKQERETSAANLATKREEAALAYTLAETEKLKQKPEKTDKVGDKENVKAWELYKKSWNDLTPDEKSSVAKASSEKPEGNLTREQLTALSLKGDKGAKAILDDIDKRDVSKKASEKSEPPYTPQEKARGKALAEGRLDPKLIGALGKGRTRTIDAAFDVYPNLNTNYLEANIKAIQDIVAIRSTRNIEAVKPRLDDLQKMFDAENNNNTQLANKIKNDIGKWLGSNKLTKTEYSRDTIAQEMMLALSQSSSGSDLRVTLDRAGLDPRAMSSAQFASAVKVAKEALGTKEIANKLLPYTWEEVRGEQPKIPPGSLTSLKTATNTKTGEVMVLRDGIWQKQ